MKYVTIRISSDQGEVLYEKDVEIRNAFEAFIRHVVSDHVSNDRIKVGEHYSAIVIPRYGRYLIVNPLMFEDPEGVSERTAWIEMRFEDGEPPHLEKSVNYFTVEVRVRERNLIFRRDYQTSEVGRYYVKYGVMQALIGLRVLTPGDMYRTEFFARDDDAAQFDRERIPTLEARAASLIELTEAPKTPSFSFRDPALYRDAEVKGNPAASDMRIYVNRETLGKLLVEGELSQKVERGGILVGEIFRATDGGPPIVEVSDMIVSEHTISSVVELRYTFESWRDRSAKMKERFPGKRIVGWYHTHLVEIGNTTMFFSRDDVFLHEKFFPDDWYVAMVLDPEGKTIFFQWKDRQVVPCGGYRVFENLGVAEVV